MKSSLLLERPNMLLCPNCKAELKKLDRKYICENGHSFDIARQGYTNLLVHTQKATGDSKEMVDARDNFFKSDYYRILRLKMIELMKKYQPAVIVDAGCGEGYYTNAINEAGFDDIYGFDMSKFALMRASRDNKQVKYFAANLFYIPLSDNSADLIYSIFAPIAMEENDRILKEGGIFIKVGPAARHLYEMKQEVYPSVYENEVKEIHYQGFTKIDDFVLEDKIHLKSNADINALFKMTPYYHTSPKAGKEHLLSMDELDTTIAFKVEIYQKDKQI